MCVSLWVFFQAVFVSLNIRYKGIDLAQQHKCRYVINLSLREKCPNTEFFQVLFSLIRVFNLNAGKYGPEKNSVFEHFSRSVWGNF